MKEMIRAFCFLKLPLYEQYTRPQCNDMRYRVISSTLFKIFTENKKYI